MKKKSLIKVLVVSLAILLSLGIFAVGCKDNAQTISDISESTESMSEVESESETESDVVAESEIAPVPETEPEPEPVEEEAAFEFNFVPTAALSEDSEDISRGQAWEIHTARPDGSAGEHLRTE